MYGMKVYEKAWWYLQTQAIFLLQSLEILSLVIILTGSILFPSLEEGWYPQG
jgi:hypothetical protein